MTICGRPTYNHSNNIDLSCDLPLCRSCFRAIDYRVPKPEVIWTATWYEIDDILEKTIRDCSEFEHLRMVVLHHKFLTRVWIERLPGIQYTPHSSVKQQLDTIKLWIDTGYYRVIRLQPYMEQLLYNKVWKAVNV